MRHSAVSRYHSFSRRMSAEFNVNLLWEPVETIELSPSRRKASIRVVRALLICAILVHFAWSANGVQEAVLWVLAAFFASTTVVFAMPLWEKVPRIVVSEVGLWDRSWGAEIIPWEEISGFEIKDTPRLAIISVLLKDTEKWVSRMSPSQQKLRAARASFGCQPIVLNLINIEKNAQDLVREMQERLKIA
jgi:hypothetical protein